MGYLDDSRFGDGEQRIVTISEVNTANHQVKVLDDYGTTLYITLHLQDSVLAIPSPGERWLVERQGVDWFLEKRKESTDATTPLTSMAAGDKRVEADSTLFLNGKQITLQGVVFISNGSPTDNPKGGGYLFVESGALKYKGSNGTVTTIAPA